MADLSDIEAAIVSTLAQAIYPNGTSQPSVANAPCKIYRGWPIPASLDSDLAQGIVNVSVFPNNNESPTTRYSRNWQELPVTPASLVLTVSNNTVTASGFSGNLNAAIFVDGRAYVYPAQPGATLTQIATALANLINVDTPATSNGATISIPSATKIKTRVGVHGTLIRELKRQKRTIQISFWCPTPQIRDAIVAPCDAFLASLTFIALPDGSSGRILYQRSSITDQIEKAGLYRRDLFYSVEYATTDSQTSPQIVTELLSLAGGIDPQTIKTFSL